MVLQLQFQYEHLVNIPKPSHSEFEVTALRSCRNISHLELTTTSPCEINETLTTKQMCTQ